MRTIFMTEDVKNIVENIFNGNLAQYRASKGSIAYNNPNSENILLIDEDDGSQKQVDLAEYLNIKFYNWKERLVSKDDRDLEERQQLTVFDDWVQSLNVSMNESYALVEKIDEEVTASQDIDSATILGKITFLVQADKIQNLDYYVSKLKSSYLGNPQEIQNSFGQIRKCFIVIGALSYDQEPFMTQLGETVIVSCNFGISYLNDVSTYNDTKIEISLDNGVNYYEIPITKGTYQTLFSVNPIPRNGRPNITGVLSSACSMSKTIAFYDYNKNLTNALTEIFWGTCAYKIDDTLTTIKEVNIPVYLKVTKNGHVYYHKDVIERMEKVITDNDFDVCSLTLRTWGKN